IKRHLTYNTMNIFKSILSLCVLLFLSFSTTAQKNSSPLTLSGTITTEKNEPLGSASIYISDLKKGTIADSHGHYELKNIPFGTYLVEVKFMGYKTRLEQIYFNENKTVD